MLVRLDSGEVVTLACEAASEEVAIAWALGKAMGRGTPRIPTTPLVVSVIECRATDG